MTDNKKKSGFWSWLGLGKKDQQAEHEVLEKIEQERL
ncbi:cell division protein FtsY, partial [Chelonobacter oris]